VKTTFFPTLEECLALHGELIRRFGGQGGLRDPGMLDSALARPRSGYYPSLSQQAAALMQSLARNHAFTDGNKRMAFAVTAIFLRMNGYRLPVTADEGETFLIGRVIEAKADLEEITGWIEAHMRKARP
jgi:death-on-curing protein